MPSIMRAVNDHLMDTCGEFRSGRRPGGAANVADDKDVADKMCQPTGAGDTLRDICSLGVVLYQILTGHLPFECRVFPVPAWRCGA